ncbi:MAG: sensor histidine kinase [Bryobacteraceae bacterium]
MVPIQARQALRIGRVALAMACLAWYPFTNSAGITSTLAFLIAYAIFAVGTLFETRFDSEPRAIITLVIDAAFFAFCKWLLPADGANSLAFGYLMIEAAILHTPSRVAIVAGASLGLYILSIFQGAPVPWLAFIVALICIAYSFHRRYLERRVSNTLRYNVIVRSQAEGAREAERERIAADFHDGPLQNFISFQMRLEIIRRLLSRDVDAAASELRQLQDLCRHQVSELRGFVRSMRPADEGVTLSASLSRMAEQFQRDTGISTTFSSAEFHDPAATEVSLELLQIVRETLNNVHKHSGASRVALSVGKRGEKLEVKAEDNGGGYPFSGTFTLDELEMLRMGPVSIKRRVRMLGGELLLESRPGQGSSLEIRVPLN